MRRITVEEVRAALEKTGYRLRQRVTIDHNGKCGCPIGVMAVHEGYRDGAWFFSGRHLGLSESYQTGVEAGFDKLRRDRDGDDEYQLGHDDGSAIRVALLPAAPEPTP